MSLEDIVLPTNKTETKISNNRRKIRTGEAGLSIKVTVVDANDQPYNLTDFDIVFSEQKDQGKVVVDDGSDKESGLGGSFVKDDPVGGTFTYTLAKDVYGASGRCWFALKKGQEIIDTTKDFYFDVLKDATIHIDNDNYVSSLQAELDDLKANNQRIKDAANQELDSLKSQIQHSKDLTEQSKQDALNAIQEAKDTATATLNSLNGQYNSYASKYEALESKITGDIKSINDRADSQINSIKADWDKEKQAAESDRATIRQNGTDEINSIKSDWSEQTNAINVDAKTKIDAAIAAVETARDNAIKQAVSDFSNQRDNLQADYNSWKQDTVKDFNSQLTTLQGKIDAETKQQSDLKAAIDSARAAVDKIPDVDFTKFAHKDDVDQALKSIDFGKIGIKENYLNPSTNVATRTIFPVKQSDGNWIFDRASDDATAETAKKALEQVLQNGKTLNQLSEQFNTKANKNDVDQALKSIDFGKIAFRKQYTTNQSGTKSYKTWSAKKQTDGTWLIDISNDDWTAANARDALEKSNSNEGKINDLQGQINDRATNSTVNVAAPLFKRITSSNTWQDILGVANGNQVLVSIRDEAGGNTLGNFGSAVAFGGGDTKGVLNVAYADHRARIIGGNSDRPQWHEDIAWKSDIQNLLNMLNQQSQQIQSLTTQLNKGNGFVPITQADYDALTDDQKANGMYAIGDSN